MIVRKLRLKKGWSQEHLAELTNLSIRTIQRVERGQKPGFETARSLAAIFEVNLSTFQIREKAMNKEDRYTEDTTNNLLDNGPKLEEDEREAFNYVKNIKDFFAHLIFYLIFTIVIIVKKDLNEANILWPLIIWTLGVIVHGLMAFVYINLDRYSLFSTNWEKKLVEKRIGRKLK